jgi:hypothetical protein
MTTQLLIYQSAVPVSAARHGKHVLEVGNDYGFARAVNSMPLTAVEILPTSREYPVVFAGNENGVMPAALLGMRDKQNVFVDKEGNWSARYVPAFARRYPFVFASADDGTNFTLCIDEAFSGLAAEGAGQRMFDDENKPTEYVNNVLKFLQQYQIEFQKTQAFCKRLLDLKVFEPMQAQVNLAEGARLSMTGFMAVNRDRLKEIPDEAMAELVKNDGMELIYAHMHSLQHFNELRDRTLASDAAVAQPPAAVPQKAEKPAAEAAPEEGRKTTRKRQPN